LYLRMSNVLLNNSVLAIHGLSKSSEIVLLTNHSRSTFVLDLVLSCNAYKWRNKVKNTNVRFSVRNCTYGCQIWVIPRSRLEIESSVKCITKQQYSSDLWPLSLKSKRNCIANESLKIIQLIIKKCSTFDHC
jgi:hypothetical protein